MTPKTVSSDGLASLPGRIVLQVRLSEPDDDPDVFYIDVDVLVGLDAEILYEIGEAVIDTLRAEIRGLEGAVEA